MGNTDLLWFILVWGGPLVALQWLIGLDILIRRWKVWVLGIGLSTLYLMLVVSVALGIPLWQLNLTQFTGLLIPIVNVPIEIALLVGIANTLLVQGMIFLLNGPQIMARVRGFIYLIRRGPAGIRELEENAKDTAKDTEES